MEIRVQAGGLSGIQSLLTPEPQDKVADIYTLIELAEAEFGSLENLPYNQIMQSVSSFQGRKSRKRS